MTNERGVGILASANAGRWAGIASDTRVAGAVAILLGLLFVGVAGFAPIEAIHDAAHDTRHAAGFPCH